MLLLLGSADMIFKAINSWGFPQFSDETICNPRVRRDYWKINNLSLACHFNTLTQFPVPRPSNVLETWEVFWKQQVPTIGLWEYAAALVVPQQLEQRWRVSLHCTGEFGHRPDALLCTAIPGAVVQCRFQHGSLPLNTTLGVDFGMATVIHANCSRG